jgi:large subunit ribosomal protein L9
MKIILLEELKGRGVEGDVIDVAPGFANNYLLPNGKAVLATKGNLKQLEQRRNNIAKREAARVATAEELKAKLDGATVKINARVGEEGVLFGSVTAQMVADALKEQHGVEVDRRLIDFKEAVKTAGEHEAVLSLHRDVKAALKLLVGDDEWFAVAEEAEAEAEEAEEAAEEAAEKAAE